MTPNTGAKQTARLEKWGLRLDEAVDPYKAPETVPVRLVGYVYGHPRVPDGTLVSSSTVIELDVKNSLAETKNTTYTLGEIDPIYKRFDEVQRRAIAAKD